MHHERLTHSLLSELYDLEEDAYRLSLREAGRDGSPPAVALRAVAGHANEALEELPALVRERSLRLSSARSLARDTCRRVRDLVLDRLVDHEQSYRRALTAVHKGIDLVRVVHAAALDEADDGLARWCQRWLSGREALLADASEELAWFGRHPFSSRPPVLEEFLEQHDVRRLQLLVLDEGLPQRGAEGGELVPSLDLLAADLVRPSTGTWA